ncbi:regulator of chromosome condensation family protein [Striga asiatica]|uniref:Regulator of chromosome condensation family protein n=1 Tax=Striga asiatica TaxID=4170 RepID=A0A5A7Q4J6_STRAF|nr:regulator of chromosome condensation family protein [Striga asiatica]
MSIALGAKTKFGFVDGQVNRPDPRKSIPGYVAITVFLFRKGSKCLPSNRVHLLDSDSEKKEWDRELILQTFNPIDAELILTIPISHHGGKDFLVWHWDQKGRFSVKSAYETIRRHRRMQEVGEPTTKQQMANGGMELDTRCDICGEHEETVCWKLCGLWWQEKQVNIQSFKDWWIGLKIELNSIYVVENLDQVDNCNDGQGKWMEFRVANEDLQGQNSSHQLQRIPQVEQFSREVGQVSCSVSASLSTRGKLGLGGAAVRDEQEIFTWATGEAGRMETTEGMLSTIRYMFQKLKEMKIKNVVCFIPDLNVAKLLRNQVECQSRFKSIIFDIWWLSKDGLCCNFVFDPGECTGSFVLALDAADEQ